MTQRLAAIAIGLTIFWTPPIVALVGGSVANALVLLTPLALAASYVWIRACQRLLPMGRLRDLDPGTKAGVITSGLMMIGWVALAVSIDQDFTAVFLTFITWSIVVVISPFTVWWGHRMHRLARAREAPGQRITRWVKEQPPED